MDLIPITDNQEYVLCDRNLVVAQLSDKINKYSEFNIIVGEDIRKGFPEIIGLESTCEAILLGNQTSFVLESITRSQDFATTIYFNLSIRKVSDNLAFLIEDVSELMQLKQSLIQQLNESEIALGKLQRFEYCTNKIIASMRDVLLITTPTGKIERVNKSTIELFGYKKSELIGRSIDSLIPNQSFNHLEIYNFLLSSKDTVKKIDVDFINKDRQQVHIEFDCFIAPTEVKDFFNCIYIGRDITARKQVEAKIKKSLAREKELRQLKSGFISMASHEFRNPLSSILLCIQNLSSNLNLEESERQFYLQSIQDAALNMNALLEDVLILSKAESGQQKIKLVQLNLEEFCRQIIKEISSVYVDRKIDFNYLIPIDKFALDGKNLRHILSNLLSNALKYSPKQTTVNLNISSSNIEHPQDIIIEVCDRGIGIPVESQKHLFESFYRANNVGNTPGTGLGLSIVSKAVELYKGTIAIDSTIDQGTTIIVTLPIL